jgi:hypothetical protein
VANSTWKTEPTQRRSSRAHERGDIFEQGTNDKGLPGPKTTIANYVENKYVHLIVAAPDLLDALINALPNLEWANIHGSRCEETINQVRAAIAKAVKP